MPLVYASGAAPVTRRERALAVREACLGWLHLGGLLARLTDPVVRCWMRSSGAPYLGENDAVTRAVGRPGTWLLHGAYLFGCTALADEGPEGPRLRRTLDWPFSGSAGWSRWCADAGPQANISTSRGRVSSVG